jgi:hypothetical protein
MHIILDEWGRRYDNAESCLDMNSYGCDWNGLAFAQAHEGQAVASRFQVRPAHLEGGTDIRLRRVAVELPLGDHVGSRLVLEGRARVEIAGGPTLELEPGVIASARTRISQ